MIGLRWMEKKLLPWPYGGVNFCGCTVFLNFLINWKTITKKTEKKKRKENRNQAASSPHSHHHIYPYSLAQTFAQLLKPKDQNLSPFLCKKNLSSFLSEKFNTASLGFLVWRRTWKLQRQDHSLRRTTMTHHQHHCLMLKS